jgi:hypothetical protein
VRALAVDVALGGMGQWKCDLVFHGFVAAIAGGSFSHFALDRSRGVKHGISELLSQYFILVERFSSEACLTR